MKAENKILPSPKRGKPNFLNRTHGYAIGPKKTPVYIAWLNMKARCYNPKSTFYKDYGGRGITVCERWKHSFENFLSDMGEPSGDSRTIERADNNLGYCKSNCLWAGRKPQANNRRSNVFMEFNGKRRTLSQWADDKGMKLQTLHQRLTRGWSVSEILNTPVRKLTIR